MYAPAAPSAARRFAARAAALLLCAAAVPSFTEASELSYKPVNPSFGGNPFNASHLQFLATNQRQYDAPRRKDTRDPLAEFSSTMTSRLLSRLSGDITDRIFGENGQDQGTYKVGDTTVDFVKIGDIVRLTIKDASTGGETTVDLPAAP